MQLRVKMKPLPLRKTKQTNEPDFKGIPLLPIPPWEDIDWARVSAIKERSGHQKHYLMFMDNNKINQMEVWTDDLKQESHKLDAR